MPEQHGRGPVFEVGTLAHLALKDLDTLQLQGEGIRKAIGFSTTIMKLRRARTLLR